VKHHLIIKSLGVLSGVSFIKWEKYSFRDGDQHVLGNDPLYNYIGTVVCGAFWVINAIPYFLAVPRGRRGPDLPEGANQFTIGWKSIYVAFKEARKLRYLFLYLFAYLLFADGVSTTNQMIGIIQGEITSFSAQQVTILNLASAVTSIIGCLFFLWLAKRFNIKTKTNLLIIIFLSGVVAVWGCFGIGLDNFGLKTNWELWVFYVWTGLFTAPIWVLYLKKIKKRKRRSRLLLIIISCFRLGKIPCWLNSAPEERRTCSLVSLVSLTRAHHG
jgi:MFS-type transporter involved in bile tolerance (Atg22 family)